VNSPLPPGDITVERLATEQDLDAVAALEARCFSNPWDRAALAAELARSDVTQVFVLRLGTAVAGFCFCWTVVDELHVNTMAIDGPYRRLGLGTRLMRAVMADAARRGVTRATLEVRATNVAARKLYESLGFTVVAIRSRYYTQPEDDALIMWHDDIATPQHPES
jgi:[ribosomal protein S18]-alanine N-acetyltransferase